MTRISEATGMANSGKRSASDAMQAAMAAAGDKVRKAGGDAKAQLAAKLKARAEFKAKR